MRHDFTRSGAEPSLTEVLGDPLVQLIMQRDGVKEADLRRLIDAARRRLTAAQVGAVRAELATPPPASTKEEPN